MTSEQDGTHIVRTNAMNSDFEDLCTEIRSILNSSKDQMTTTALSNDYVTIIGSPIPYKKLGYATVEDLLRAIPNLRLNIVGRNMYIDLKPDEKTAHIAKLVQGQADKKKGGKKKFWKPPPPRRTASGGNYRSNYSNNSNNFRSSNSHRNNVQSSNNFNNRGRTSNDCYSNVRSTFGTSSNYNSRGQYYSSRGPAMSQHQDSNTYKKTTRTEYDFSDEEDYEVTGFEEESESPEEVDHFRPKADEKKLPDFQNLSVTVGNSALGAGRGNALLRGAANLSNRHFSQREDSYRLSSSVSRSKDVRDVTISSNSSNSLLTKTSPAAILATGRAARNETAAASNNSPGPKSSVVNGTNSTRSLFGSAIRSTLKDIRPVKLLNGSASKETTSNSMAPPRRSENSVLPPKPAKMVGSYLAGPDSQPAYLSKSLCQQLYAFTVKHHLSLPFFTNFNRVDPKTGEKMFVSHVKIGDSKNFSSFSHPQTELTDLSLAQEYAAGLALQELNESNLSDLMSTTAENQQIIKRISEIVKHHPTGLKSEAVQQKYAEQFHEKLPADWLQIVRSSPSPLSVEKLVGGVFVYPPQNTEGGVRNVNKLPPLVIPADNEWSIFITTCVSTTYVYFRIIGEEYSTKYEELAQRMDELYEKRKDDLSPAQAIKEGNYYAAHLQGEWYRVKVLSPDLGETYRVSLVDHGDTDEVLKESIFDLEDELTTLPAQAIRCSLTGLEQFHDNEYVTHTLNSMTQSTTTRVGFVASVDSRSPHLMITIFDTTTDIDINLNDALKQKMDRELTPPRIPAQSSLVEVYLTRVKEDGGAHVQIISDGLKRLMSSMVDVKNEMLKHEEKYRIKSVTNLIGEKIILAKYHGDGTWHRAVVKSLLNRNETAQVHFIDYGNIEIIPIEHLAVIKHFEYVLTAIPPQAVEVQITRSTRELFTQSVIEFLMSLAHSTDDDEAASRLFLMKVINSAPVPDVEFFLRDDNNELVRLNNIIGSYCSEYRGTDFELVQLNLGKNDL